MKLAIIGSRSFEDYPLAAIHIQEVIEKENLKLTHIVSGGAKGADQLGARFALAYHLELIVFKPDWKRYGKRAGFIRNTEIVAHADCILAFWDGQSKGTKDSIDKATGAGKKVIVVYV
ncbi:SLOG family protein [Myroides fluvii]|uniref:SLOG family protein n=1 Tax=Myroides fluvii TaxID=2572594 RepID=UPI00131D6E9A|nr:SLOG family protein [Myroides fluvii]